MAEGRSREQWNYTATVLAMIANVNRDPKKRSTPYGPADFNPYTAIDRPKQKVKMPIGVLKDVFINRKMPKGIDEPTQQPPAAV